MFINECLWQITEGSAEVRDVFHLLFEVSDIVGFREIKLSLVSEMALVERSNLRQGRLVLFGHVEYISWATQTGKLCFGLLLPWDTLLHPWVSGQAGRNPG